jgi:hypothetical protein
MVTVSELQIKLQMNTFEGKVEIKVS